MGEIGCSVWSAIHRIQTTIYECGKYQSDNVSQNGVSKARFV